MLNLGRIGFDARQPLENILSPIRNSRRPFHDVRPRWKFSESQLFMQSRIRACTMDNGQWTMDEEARSAGPLAWLALDSN
jgi:hypothetical protein